MPFEGLARTELVSCPICMKVFNEKEHRPFSLRCGHSVCQSCLKHRFTDGGVKRCPFDQKELPSSGEHPPATNYALMQLVGAVVQEEELPQQDTVDHPACYRQACQCIVDMALHLKPLIEVCSDDDSDSEGGTPSNKSSHCVLSRPMQRKLISLVHCQLSEEEGRSRAARIARSLGERIITELLLLHQFPHQLSANLWAAVRTRGCQFLGPAMQEEVLKLILLALEDGSFLSRKVLVLFVVQKLEGKYPQASKTAIGHVVQLLYRASCFKVMKRDEESSLMQLKDEFRQYEALRREHDSQIVQIALEAGLRISPEQWSSLLYGDAAHKSHMQSIIDKHQSPQSFSQSLSELMLTLERIGDPKCLKRLQPQLEFLSKIDPNPECPAPSWENLEAIMRALKTAVNMFADFLTTGDHRLRLEATPLHNSRYKTSKCRDFIARGSCPRGNTCTFAHSQEELERYRSRSRRSGQGHAEKTSSSLTPSESDQLKQIQELSLLKLDQTIEQSELDTGVTPGHRLPTCASSEKSHHQQRPPSGLMHGLGQDQPPFFPLGVPNTPATRITFSRPTIDGVETACRAPPSHQTAYHPNSLHQTPYHPSSSYQPAYCSSPHIPPPGPYSPPSQDIQLPTATSTSSGTSSSFQLASYDVPSHTASYVPRTPSLAPSEGWMYSAAAAGGEVYHPHSPLAAVHRDTALPYMLQARTTAELTRQQAKKTLADLPVQQDTILPNWTSQNLEYLQQLREAKTNQMRLHNEAKTDPTLQEHLQSATLMELNTQHQEMLLHHHDTKKTLADLTFEKQELMQHLQAEPVFLEPTQYKADAHKGIHRLQSVLSLNNQQCQLMPKVVSDMYVATRSTQSLDKLLEGTYDDRDDEWSNYSPEWLSDMDIDGVNGSDLPACSHSQKCPASLAAQIRPIINPAGSGAKSKSEYEHVFNHFQDDCEFSMFPGDDSDETFIPFDQTKSSRFGPISRLTKTNYTNPVQVTADSGENRTPVLAMMDSSSLTTPMTAVSRFHPAIGLTEPAVKPTPMEAPSVWQQSPHPSYQNIARLKVGAGEAVSNNERLAYELQAVELEISMRTGQAPEPVSRLIQEAVGGPHHLADSPSVSTAGNAHKAGYLAQQLMHLEQSMLSPHKATHSLLDDYCSWQGM